MPPAAAPPSIYQNMAGMAMGQGGGGPKSPDAAKGDAGGGPGGMEEKKQILTTLLEVFKKWDKLESDASGKKIISDMVALAERYKKEVLKEGGADAGTPPPAADAGGPPAGAPPDAGGAGGKKGPDVPS
jgi:hypothetical protein